MSLVKGELKSKMDQVFERAENMMFDLFKETVGVNEIINMDAESGKMMGTIMEIYSDTKDLYLAAAETIDDLESDIKDLKDGNESLRKQIDYLIGMVRERP